MISWKEIHWIDVDGLAIRLREGNISEDLAFQHLLIFTALTGSGVYIPIRASGSSDDTLGPMTSFGLYIVFAVVNFYGLLHSYRINQSGDGKQYFMRLSALTLPISIRLMLLLILPFLIVALLLSFADLPRGDMNSILGVLLVGVSVIYYWLLGKALQVASRNAT